MLIPNPARFYNKTDLIYQYCWTSDLSPETLVVNGAVDISQGEQVLYIINLFAQRRNFASRHSGVKIEKMLHIYLPAEIISLDEIMEWIEQRWFDFM